MVPDLGYFQAKVSRSQVGVDWHNPASMPLLLQEVLGGSFVFVASLVVSYVLELEPFLFYPLN